jgi:hypothetical protein
MEQYPSIDHVLENMDKNIIYQKKNSIVTGLSLIIAGAAVLALSFSPMFSSTGFMPHLLLIIGVSLIVVGIVLAAFRKKHFYSSEHGKLLVKEISFDNSERDKLIRLLAKGEIEEIKGLKKSVNNSVILKLFISKNDQICFSQVKQFVNFSYENISETKQHPAHEAHVLKSI